MAEAQLFDNSNRIVIVAITGPIGSGKSVLAEMCAGICGEEYIFPISKKVYEISNEVYRMLDIAPVKNRKLLQTIGDIGRSHNKDYWIDEVVKSIFDHCKRITGIKSRVVYYIPDLRYSNELETLYIYFNTVYLVRLNGSFREEITDHDSESELINYINADPSINFDAVFDLNTTIFERVSMIKNMIRNGTSNY